MKVLLIGLALAGIGATTPLDAQMTVRNPASTRNDDRSNTSGSWYSVGRDANGNAIYERRTRDGNGNIVIQRARRNSNGTMTIISTRTIRSGDNRDSDRNRRNCDYSRTTNSVGDILFGRTNDRVCDDVNHREDGGWYQVGRGRDNNSIYVRRTRDANGNLVIQRARRNADGTFTVFSTRTARDSDKAWKKAHKAEHREMKSTLSKEEHKDWKKDDKQEHKADKQAAKGGKGKGRGNN